jgi:Domain of unknown function (DUF397)
MSTSEPVAEGLAWRKASRSAANGECVEVALTHAYIAVRDSKNPTGDILMYSARTWRSFLQDAKGGALDLPSR